MCIETIITSAIGASRSGKGDTPPPPPAPAKPPPVPAPPKASDAATRKLKEDAARAEAGKFGISDTNQTGGLGLSGAATTTKKNLLGSNG